MSLLQIYQWVCQWKNFENRLTFAEVIGKSLVSCFFETQCSLNDVSDFLCLQLQLQSLTLKQMFSEESCSVVGLSEKMSFQLRSELSATAERWAEVRWKCVPDDRSRDGETSLADGRVSPQNERTFRTPITADLNLVVCKCQTWQCVIRYDTRCCFNVRSKADMSQLNLLRGNDNWKV